VAESMTITQRLAGEDEWKDEFREDDVLGGKGERHCL